MIRTIAIAATLLALAASSASARPIHDPDRDIPRRATPSVDWQPLAAGGAFAGLLSLVLVRRRATSSPV